MGPLEGAGTPSAPGVAVRSTVGTGGLFTVNIKVSVLFEGVPSLVEPVTVMV
ncbi:MAG: hypothetical protein HYT38_00200 [Candidatus Sungbacteria bacterium]|uniref:Uncharacterized protein n=1 Tax=Candidatus Sungiibacteriota bacterium TaxID=2750080 RepID=A0A9D6HSE1_9BACT|nr:hypothetical protein [Candidatus Sungbacteria bacterium]